MYALWSLLVEASTQEIEPSQAIDTEGIEARLPSMRYVGLRMIWMVMVHFLLSWRMTPVQSLRSLPLTSRHQTRLKVVIPEKGPPPIEREMRNVSQVEDDGYQRSSSHGSIFSRFRNKFQSRPPGTLILVRHGESLWNFNKTFTGWCDVDLSDLGTREVEHAARLLLERGYTVDIAYTSRLKRAIRSVWIILKELNMVHLPVFKSWRLNERMYGALEGLSKPQLALELGE